MPGLERIAAEADTAGRVVLQDGDRRLGQLPELLGEREGGVDVDHIIVGELLPVERLGHTEELAVQRRGLVRVLAVAHVERLRAADVEARTEPRGPLLAEGAEVVGDRAVVARGRAEDLLGEAAVGQRRDGTGRPELLEHRPVVVRIDHHRHVGVVLRRRAEHRGPPDVDLLDRLGERRPGPCDGLPEGIEVDRNEVDRLDVVRAHGRCVLSQVAAPEEPTVDLRVEGLHAPVEHLGKAGVVAHLPDREAGLRQDLRRPAGREDLDIERREAARELDHAPLVAHAEQRSPDPAHHRSWHASGNSSPNSST